MVRLPDGMRLSRKLCLTMWTCSTRLPRTFQAGTTSSISFPDACFKSPTRQAHWLTWALSRGQPCSWKWCS
ncbi:hypothetical protein HaLaN_11689, partial [Haematococcus lacustris]